jgi:hypothetical protein
VAEQIGIGPDRRILDLGCGWGPLLNFIRAQGASELGVTLSSAQEAACTRHGLDVRLYDARLLDRESFGEFDAVASLGAFEHFCSVEEYRDGRQEEIYRGREKIAREHTHMWSIADAATQFVAMADRPSTVTIRVESVSVPQGNDRQTGQRQGAANAYGAHALHICASARQQRRKYDERDRPQAGYRCKRSIGTGRADLRGAG